MDQKKLSLAEVTAIVTTAWQNQKCVFLNDVDLSELDLSDFELIGACFARSTLTKVNLPYDLRHVDFHGADLCEVDLSDRDFTDADFIGADLSHSNCTESVFWGTNLTNADISCANFQGADLNGVIIDNNNWHKLFGNLTDCVMTDFDYWRKQVALFRSFAEGLVQ